MCRILSAYVFVVVILSKYCMQAKRPSNSDVRKFLIIALTLVSTGALLPPASNAQSRSAANRTAPVLGADLVYADWPHPLIDGWLDRQRGEEMTRAFESAGLRSLRFSFHGFYSPRGLEASIKVRDENRLKNEFPWFPLDAYVDYIAANRFTTVVAVNVEEGPEVALSAAQKFIDRGLQPKLVAIELSNEPWLNHRPWWPEEYAARAADVILHLSKRFAGSAIRFGLPLTVGRDRNTPTKLSDTEWVTRMLRALDARIGLKQRSDVLGVIHLYSDGVRARSIDFFNKVVQPFIPNVRYLVTEFNIRLSLEGNPHLTNKYAMEFARKLAELMANPQIDGLYIHGVPYHSIVYWANRRVATVIGHSDPKIRGATPGWHLTPTGQVYQLYSRVAWNGRIISYQGKDKERQWAVRGASDQVVVTFLNDNDSARTKRFTGEGFDANITAPAHSIVCTDKDGKVINILSLPY